jgi:hypothetical protein
MYSDFILISSNFFTENQEGQARECHGRTEGVYFKSTGNPY